MNKNGTISNELAVALRTRNPTKEQLELVTEATHRALKTAVQEALRRHKKLGQSIVIEVDGKVIHVPAAQIKVPRKTK